MSTPGAPAEDRPASGVHPSGAPTSGAPTEDEVVAILAAVELLWPRPVVVPEVEEPANAWRFSGRWWARPVTARRARPWVDQGF